MSISPNTEQWLHEVAGYEYHCFISWAHTSNTHMTNCADRLKEAIEQQLALSIPNPRVFLDKEELTGGDEWEKRITHALCRSMALVAMCAPIYYHPKHKWCGIEYEAMRQLSKKRLPNQDFTAIIPIMIKPDNPIPAAVSQIQWIDFSKVIVCGKRYFTTKEFRQKVREVVERIEQIAEVTAQNSSITDCEQYHVPQNSAFADYQVKRQSFPLTPAVSV